MMDQGEKTHINFHFQTSFAVKVSPWIAPNEEKHTFSSSPRSKQASQPSNYLHVQSLSKFCYCSNGEYWRIPGKPLILGMSSHLVPYQWSTVSKWIDTAITECENHRSTDIVPQYFDIPTGGMWDVRLINHAQTSGYTWLTAHDVLYGAISWSGQTREHVMSQYIRIFAADASKEGGRGELLGWVNFAIRETTEMGDEEPAASSAAESAVAIPNTA